MDVLVTGGNGSIGRFVVEELASRGHDVSVFDIQSGFDMQETSFVEGDITDKTAVTRAISDKDAVVHLAALLPPRTEESPERANRINVDGTLNALNAARQADARAIVASSKAVYGHVSAEYAYPRYEPLSEDMPKNPMDVYGITKRAVEHFCNDYANNRGLDVATVRFASTYGPGKIEEYDNHGDFGDVTLISKMVEGALSGDAVTVRGGDERNDYLYFADIGIGIADAIEAQRLNYRTYNLGTGSVVTLHKLAEILRDLCPDADLTVKGGLDPYDRDNPRYCRMDISRARADLGFEPRYPPREGFRDYLDRLG